MAEESPFRGSCGFLETTPGLGYGYVDDIFFHIVKISHFHHLMMSHAPDSLEEMDSAGA